MGTWQSTLYGNDTTCDVRDTYMNYLEEQLSNQEAFEKTLKDYEELIGDEDEEPLFWFALAETQWKIGRLTLDVKEKALEWIKNNGGVNLWEESESGSKGWKKTLSKLEVKLESPMRSEKKIRKPEIIDHNLWKVGDVYAYHLHAKESKENGTCGKYVILQKMGESQRYSLWQKPEPEDPVYMAIYVFDKLFDDIPNLDDIEGLPILPRSILRGDVVMPRLMELFNKRHYPKSYLTYLGNKPISIMHRIFPDRNTVYWDKIEEGINYCMINYRDKEYEEVEKGIFKVKDNN